MQSANSVLLCVCELDGLHYIYTYNDVLIKQLLVKKKRNYLKASYTFVSIESRFDILSVSLLF